LSHARLPAVRHSGESRRVVHIYGIFLSAGEPDAPLESRTTLWCGARTRCTRGRCRHRTAARARPSADGGVAAVRRTPAWLLRSGDVCWQENRDNSVVDFFWRAFCPRFAGTALHRRVRLRCVACVARRAASRKLRRSLR
jgi:hypothetical protein